MKRVLIEAVYNRDYDSFAKLITPNDVHVKDTPREWSLLHYAASISAPKFICKCLEMGADVNAINSSGQTPIMFVGNTDSVTKHDVKESARLLLDAGALDIKDDDGTGAFDRCITHGITDPIWLLIDYGFKPIRDISLWDSVSHRNRSRNIALLLMGLRKFYPLQDVFSGQDVNVVRMIAKQIWSWRLTLEAK